MAEIEVNGVRLYYEEHGEGEPIACIHGAGSSALLWDDAVARLAQFGRVIVYDRRGCARSERPDPYETTSIVEQAEDAAALLEALTATPAIVIGRSYGGAVAIELGLRHPNHVRALALLEGDAFGLSPAAVKWTARMRGRLREIADEAGVDAVYEALVDEVAGEDAWASFPAQVRRVLSENGPALLAELNYVDQSHPDAAAFATIDKPTLIVVAEESPFEQRAMAEAMAQAMPSARLARVGGGHLIDPAAPDVLAFVAEVIEHA